GRVESQKPGEQVIVRDGTGQVTLLTTMKRPLKIGATIEAIGLPATEGLTTVLRQSLYRVLDASAPPPPTARGLSILRLAEQVRALKADEASHGYAVRLRGVVAWSSQKSNLIYVLDASGSVAVTLPPSLSEPPATGIRVELAGHSVAGPFASGVQATWLKL